MVLTLSISLKADSRASLKKLVLDKKVDGSDPFRRSGASPGPRKPTYNASLAIAAREREASTSPTSSPSWTLPSNDHALAPPDSQTLDESLTTQEGDYGVSQASPRFPRSVMRSWPRWRA